MSGETPQTGKGGARWVLWLPFGLVALVGLLFAWGLGHGGESRLIASHWIDKPVPAFTLPAATSNLPGVASIEMAKGQPRLINVFASWCIPCRAEAPQLEILRQRGVVIDGIAIRDRQVDLARFLAETGNPYRAIGADQRSEVQIALGSSGVPETFIVDGHGMIRQQIQGMIEPEMIPDILDKLAEIR